MDLTPESGSFLTLFSIFFLHFVFIFLFSSPFSTGVCYANIIYFRHRPSLQSLFVFCSAKVVYLFCLSFVSSSFLLSPFLWLLSRNRFFLNGFGVSLALLFRISVDFYSICFHFSIFFFFSLILFIFFLFSLSSLPLFFSFSNLKLYQLLHFL